MLVVGSLSGIDAALCFISAFLSEVRLKEMCNPGMVDLLHNTRSELSTVLNIICGMLEPQSFDFSFLMKKSVHEKLIDLKFAPTFYPNDTDILDLSFIPSLHHDVWTAVSDSLLKYAQIRDVSGFLAGIDFSLHIKRLKNKALAVSETMSVVMASIGVRKNDSNTFSEDIISVIRFLRFLPKGNASFSIIADTVLKILTPAFAATDATASTSKKMFLSAPAFTTLLSFSIDLYESSRQCLQTSGVVCLLMSVHLTAENLKDYCSPKVLKSFSDRIGIFQEVPHLLLAMRCFQCLIASTMPISILDTPLTLKLTTKLSKCSFSLNHSYLHLIIDIVARRRNPSDIFNCVYSFYNYLTYLPVGAVFCQFSNIVELLVTASSSILGPLFADNLYAHRSLGLILNSWKYFIETYPAAIMAYKFVAIIEVTKIKKVSERKILILKSLVECDKDLLHFWDKIFDTSSSLLLLFHMDSLGYL
jgi:hypothetical protein